MKRADRIAAACLLLFSLVALNEASKLAMIRGSAPGPGLLPFWLSAVMVGLSLLVLLGSLRRTSAGRGISWPAGRGLAQVGAAFGGLILYTYSISVVGYLVSTFAFVGLLTWHLGSYRWYWSSALGLAVAFGLYLVFHVWLDMGLPAHLLPIP